MQLSVLAPMDHVWATTANLSFRRASNAIISRPVGNAHRSPIVA